VMIVDQREVAVSGGVAWAEASIVREREAQDKFPIVDDGDDHRRQRQNAGGD
jgi:hypothetical protein